MCVLKARAPAIRVQADLTRLASYGPLAGRSSHGNHNANVSGAKGAVDGTSQSFTLSANDQIHEPEIYRQTSSPTRNAAPVRLTDVADVVEGLENSRVGAWYQGASCRHYRVMRQPGANVIRRWRMFARSCRAEGNDASGCVL